jgi:hypothetical protein
MKLQIKKDGCFIIHKGITYKNENLYKLSKKDKEYLISIEILVALPEPKKEPEIKLESKSKKIIKKENKNG